MECDTLELPLDVFREFSRNNHCCEETRERGAACHWVGLPVDVLTSRRNMGRSTTVSTRDPFANFKANINIIHATNARNLTYKLGVHHFAGQTQEEFAATYTRLKPGSL